MIPIKNYSLNDNLIHFFKNYIIYNINLQEKYLSLETFMLAKSIQTKYENSDIGILERNYFSQEA
jgi:hypothetical protein